MGINFEFADNPPPEAHTPGSRPCMGRVMGGDSGPLPLPFLH